MTASIFTEREVPQRVREYFADLDARIGELKADRPPAKPDEFRLAKFVAAHYRRDGKALEKMGVKAGGEATNSAGGYLVPAFYETDRWVDALRPAAIVRNLGATVIPTTKQFNNTSSPLIAYAAGLATDLTSAFAAENATLSDAEPTFAQFQWKMRKEFVFLVVSDELVDDSHPTLMDVLQATVAKKFGATETANVLNGAGTNAPLGMIPLGTIPTQAVSAALSHTAVGTALKTVRLANAPGPYGLAVHPNAESEIRVEAVPLTWAPANPIQPGDEHYMGAEVGVTTSLPTGNALFGDFSFQWIVEHPDLNILVSQIPNFANGQTVIRYERRWDTVTTQPSAFVNMTGLT